MFKTRIKKWGLDKKIKETEVLAMLEIQRQRAADGKKSCFTVRNQNVERGRITRYLKRRPDLQKRLHTISHQYLKPTHKIICRTPSSADSQQVPLIPEMQLHEDILRILRNYLDGAFQGRFWVVMGQEIYGPGKLESRQRLDEWYCGMGAVRELLSHQNANTAFAILDRLMNLIGCMIKDQDPELLYHLCYHFVRLQSDPAQAELSESLNLFICKMHNVILGDQNCLSLIWSKLISLNKKARVEAISTMFTFSARYFKDLRSAFLMERRHGYIPHNWLFSTTLKTNQNLYTSTLCTPVIVIGVVFKKLAATTGPSAGFSAWLATK